MKPLHIGIVPDGNRRWAQAHGLPASEGHRRGAERLKDILYHIAQKYPKVKQVTVWAFSSENFSRSEQEKRFIFKNIQAKLIEIADDKRTHENKLRINVTGSRLDETPETLRQAARYAMEMTKNFSRGMLNIAIGYGGKFEIFKASLGFAKWLKERPLIRTMTPE
ncbi:MAG: undecaprenyl diphosphate synthase family protein, partial [Candidatus Aenigmarchaeota archaeon]|nr:undecaprenyl diphosphate synthase family protein [Candidatus Aenigmarchaeota archaeon]